MAEAHFLLLEELALILNFVTIDGGAFLTIDGGVEVTIDSG